MMWRAGIVGCGRIGCGFDDDPKRKHVSTHAGAYWRMPGVELAALCDLEEKNVLRYAGKYGVEGRYTDVEMMLERENLDILSICTPSASHAEIALAAAANGIKAIFCEKPITDSLDAAEEMIRLCDEHGVILAVDHQRRFDPMHQQIARCLKDGKLGRLQQVTCYYTAGVANTGTHLFDLLRFYLGDVNWVEGSVSANSSRNDADPNIDAWLGFHDGTLAVIQACDVRAYTIFEVTLLGTKGRLRVGAHGFQADFEEVRESEKYSGYSELFSAEMPFKTSSSHELLLYGVAHLIDCLERKQKPISSGEDGRAALEVICALHQSAVNGRRRIPLLHVTKTLSAASR
ncbi:MAG TPA: Gfo/Idh/MocA family oxidoreductase [Candidatus Acidoferrales bacterium]|nr:Gfo/Idh/MocA family oxidoreductase [Candidatus Acidoferrales bacterium]